ncbi:MAG: hypothetical protein Q4D65_04315 [Peptostreptococcaceae bacterium]|nr:hypothetical protein [Peptostreptococcaceae bacterium]
MKKGKRKKIYVMVALLVVYLILCNRYKPIIYAASWIEVASKLTFEDNWYLISTRSCSGGTVYVFSSGEFKGKYVNLDDSPYRNLKNIFFRNANFLIEAEEIRPIYESASEIICPASYEITVKNWKIVYPIFRDYTYTPHERWFYPKSYIDQYDLDHGDYIP